MRRDAPRCTERRREAPRGRGAETGSHAGSETLLGTFPLQATTGGGTGSPISCFPCLCSHRFLCPAQATTAGGTRTRGCSRACGRACRWRTSEGTTRRELLKPNPDPDPYPDPYPYPYPNPHPHPDPDPNPNPDPHPRSAAGARTGWRTRGGTQTATPPRGPTPFTVNHSSRSSYW